jgi:bifunctional UDP-N-acetylglucosamine pyrophosphorylase / glucosamine-1-phosphate N-acetyltransferase
MSVQPIILAGGKGTRMNNPDVPKVLVPVCGQPMLSHLLNTVQATGFLPPAVVVSYHKEKVEQTYAGEHITFVHQPEQLGTGHAVRCCEDQLKGKAEIYLIMNGDHPLWTKETMQRLVDRHRESGAVMSLVTLETEHPSFWNFGRIIRDEVGAIAAIREVKDATEDEKSIQEVNPALYCFSHDWLWSALGKVDTENAQHEYYITDLLEIAVQEGQTIASVLAQDWQETLGINTPEQLQEVERCMVKP